MVSEELDNVDKGILYLLQKDARRNTTEDMAEKVGVSSSTVANRINSLEERGVILGYHPIINYSETGLGHHLLVTATVPLQDREKMMDDLMEVSGIVSIRELLTNNENLSLEVVGLTSDDVEDTLETLDSLGVDIERMEMMKQERTNPYNHFGEEFAGEDDTG
ncbi:winged helix-turn-helix transcriptional regulator [Halostella sp. JP-L12]|uniref:Lrp/AsnC family transcriptional regulator n=1 Tax=Halostella TaxID=1843185 RepID=UPI000EF8029E|nr:MULTISPECIES: winged helix-turn-helix transcriptional regulator [Halostella]NHN47996.1 winged helix-turn-helix transcriptional regulator [Halostella sp. JP-L12]